MAEDVFVWPMSAESNKGSIDMLREEIISAHQASPQRAVPIQLIFALLPLEVQGKDQAIARGAFSLAGDNWSNIAPQSLDLTLIDPVLKEFYVTLPETFSGTLEVMPPRLRVNFSPVLELEIPRIAELGIDRSKYQQLIAIDATPEVSITILQEPDGAQRQTWIEAQLVTGSTIHPEMFANVRGLAMMAASGGDPCGGDKDDPNWYVIQRRSDHLCFVHYGSIVEGGMVAYDTRYGPATYDQCSRWAEANCEFGHG